MVRTPGKPQSFEDLWLKAVFELYDITSADDFNRLDREAYLGRLPKDSYVTNLADCESRAAEKTRAFYIHTFLPWAKAHHIHTDPTLWYISGRSNCKDNLSLSNVDKHSRYWTNYEWDYDQMTVDSLFAKGEMKKAIAMAARTLRQATTNEQKARIHYSVGNAFAAKREYDRAIAHFSEAARLDPKNPDARVARGATYGDKGDYDKDIADESEAIGLDPRNSQAYACRGWAYGAKGEYGKEIDDETEAIRLAPQYARAYDCRAWSYGARGEHDKEIVDYGEVIRLNPNNAEAYILRGRAYFTYMFDRDKAIADFSRDQNLIPTTPNSFASGATCLLITPSCCRRKVNPRPIA